MFKDRLILAMLVACFALTGFGCDEPADNPGDGRMPDRASAANPLLRHYFDTNTFPREMAAWKIPEGDGFKDKWIELNFSMGGGEVVNEVRVRLFMIGPAEASESAPDVHCRVIAPDDTTSRWEDVTFLQPGGGGEGEIGTLDPNAEVVFHSTFDGVISTGNWKIQLRDPIADEDGRCLLRNASLRINGGMPATATGGNEGAIVALDGGPYNRRLPEVVAPRSNGDFGYVGANKPVKLQFQFANTFNVTRMQLAFTLRAKGEASIQDDMIVCITSPSGGWFITRLVPGLSYTDDMFTLDTWSTFIIDLDSSLPELGNGFPFLGEPANGTWTVYLWETNKDGSGIYLAPEEVFDSSTLLPATPAAMQLS